MSADSVPRLITSAAARRSGVANDPLERAAERGELTRVRQGAYAETVDWLAARPEERHYALVVAAQAAAKRAMVFSHESAAGLLGIPVLGALPSRPHATSDFLRPRRSTNAVIWHTGDLAGDVVETEGFLCTSPLRTLIDVFGSRDFASGVVSLDHVLARPEIYGVRRRDLLERLSHVGPFRNSTRAARVVEFATGLSESPFESLSMVRFWEGGFPLPEQQARFEVDGAVYFADFFFEHEDVVGESDGRGKYRDPVFLRGRTPEEALAQEKEREDAIRSCVRGFVRWGWDDAMQAQPLFRKLERAGIRASRARLATKPHPRVRSFRER
ncbi:hypothetical protein [Marisediminicola sp. LYQ85]|uniref:hypothetical protein n=1 Tax=Marisediminicola sp. LYQ85 TaxID=3391062 RepID=UPI00398365FE